MRISTTLQVVYAVSALLFVSGCSGSDSGAGAGGAGGSGAAGGGPANVPNVGGCSVFTPDDAWNTDVSGETADATLTAALQAVGGGVKIHPDFGGTDYGIPINLVPASQIEANIVFDAYPDESDPGPYPFPTAGSVKIEGNDPTACGGDCHLLVVQQAACTLYEGYACESRYDGWHCGNGAKWDLTRNSYGQRPKGWTSADAAGLPIMPGLLRLDEVNAGVVKHAIRFTMNCTAARYVAPATHFAQSGSCGSNALPMGLRVRLKASYDASGLSKGAQVVAAGMKKYGMILADNGSNFYFQGEENPGWSDADISSLKDIPSSAFEAVP